MWHAMQRDCQYVFCGSCGPDECTQVSHIKHVVKDTHLVKEVYEGTVALAPPGTLASSTREILIDLHI